MKKRILMILSLLLLTACADKEQYEKAVLEQVKKEQEGEGAKSYKIDQERMTRCVVDSTSKNMPGAFPFDPDRLTAYRNYTKMLTLTQSKDPKKTMEELQKDFGSPKALSDAHNNFADSMMNCYSAMEIETESEAK
ncbi:hypothetical protein [Methylosarcina fibrata]|uniref:hypothetical protein n=1 Tax=Methylosarcina fibrata TaxID=105972 RepID=UPI00036F1A1C|nr:hypothetical protein [Methylosarcina fibrata]